MKLKTLIGDYPVTKQFRTHTDRFAFAEFQGSVATMFKRVVRDLEFDVAEMALMTYLVAKAHGKPYRLLPFVVMARFQHPYLVFDARKNPALKPEQLAGRRVGVRSYSVTTGAWIRGILAEDHNVDISRIQWVTFEEPHVAEFRDPPNAQRAPAGNPPALPHGLDANRRNLEIAIECAYKQKMIPRRFTVEELFE